MTEKAKTPTSKLTPDGLESASWEEKVWINDGRAETTRAITITKNEDWHINHNDGKNPEN